MNVDVNKINPVDGDRLAKRWLVFARKAFENPALQAEFEAWRQAKQKAEYSNEGRCK